MRKRPKPLYNLLKLNKNHRKYIIRNAGVFCFASYVVAAIEIQRVFRGYLKRTCLRDKKRKPFTLLQLEYEEKRKQVLFDRYAMFIKKARGDRTRGYGFFKVKSIFLQAKMMHLYDNLNYRRERHFMYMKRMMYSMAAICIQRMYRKHKEYLLKFFGPDCYVRNGKIRFYDKQHDAAGIIQRSWRSYLNKEIFKYYKNMIAFREKGDPALLLKCINPSEAKLLDAASGAHVRFRLGGEIFPPTVYYKIYIHGSIVDICSFAPRDYSSEPKGRDPKHIHNKLPAISKIDRSKWYKRIENNGWRPITNTGLSAMTTELDTSISYIVQDRLKKEKNASTIEFHYSRVKRRQDIQKRRKQKKIEWLTKIYKLSGKYWEEDAERKKKVASTSHQSQPVDPPVAGADDLCTGDDMTENTEVNDLLKWCASLDFDTYIKEWQLLGISEAGGYQQQPYHENADNQVHHIATHKVQITIPLPK